ncbi:MAG: hypothetical protein HY738_08215 [Bacteroidia bacterium]|nr:hypothetical protein [Bacteroidia bacterium]
MNAIKILIFFLFFIFLACSDSTDRLRLSQDSKLSKDTMPYRQLTAVSYKINKDSLTLIKAGKPKVVKAGIPKTVKYTRYIKAGTPKVVKAGAPKVLTPGIDSIQLSKCYYIKSQTCGEQCRTIPSQKSKVPKPADTSSFKILNSKFLIQNNDTLLPPKQVRVGRVKTVPALAPRYREHALYTLKIYDIGQGLNSSYIVSIVMDRNGNLWFGTNGGGVTRYDGEMFTHFTEKEGLSNNIVRSICEDKSGNIWFGTNGGGVTCYDGKMFTHFTEKQGLSNNRVLSILEDRSGNLWFGTWGGGQSVRISREIYGLALVVVA